MKSNRDLDQRKILTLQTMVASLLAGLLGLVILWIASTTSLWGGSVVLPAVLGQIGGVLIAAVALFLFWDLIGRRALASEIMAQVGLSNAISAAGLESIGTRYLDDVEWQRLFATSKRIHILVAYASTWRRAHWDEIETAVNHGAEIRVYLPDVCEEPMISALAARFNYDPNKLKRLIREAAEEWTSLPEVSLFACRAEPVFSCYRFDDTIIATMYNHAKQRTQVPTLVCKRPGTLFNFFASEFDSLPGQSVEWGDR